MKRVVAVAVLVMAGLLIGVAVSEVALRATNPYAGFDAAIDMKQFRLTPNITDEFTIDPGMGFRPVLGNDIFNEHGTWVNEYDLEKRPGVRRVLFIGDSVTARGELVRALQQRYGDEEYEYWNAGMESFNTLQEVRLYLEFNRRIQPDHVVLTFHNNDFQTTPIAFREGDRLVVYAPGMSRRELNPWLFRHSYLYRLYLGFRLGKPEERTSIGSGIVAEVTDSLVELRDALVAEDVAFSVIVFPILLPFDEWSPVEKESRERSFEILQSLGICRYDLFDVLKRGQENGVKMQYGKNDTWHPSAAAAALFAEYLQGENILAPDGCMPTPRE